MELINNLSSRIKDQIKTIPARTEKIAKNSSTIKKSFQIVYKTFEAYDICSCQQVQKRILVDVLKKTKEVIDFYATYKNILFWSNFISQKKSHPETTSNRISVIQLIYMSCFTLSDIWENLLTLKKWTIGIVPQQNNSIVYQLLGFFQKKENEKLKGIIFCSGLALVLSHKIYQIGNLIIQKKNTASESDTDTNPKVLKNDLKTDVKKELIKLVSIDIVNTSIELIAAASPLVYELSPLTILVLSISAKSTGLICFYLK